MSPIPTWFRRVPHVLVLLLTACASSAEPAPAATHTPVPAVQTPSGPGAGFRYSTYGAPSGTTPDYWLSVGEGMQAKFPGSHPEVIWILGNLHGEGTYLNFRVETDDPFVSSGYADMNEAILDQFDQRGFKVWLQVEPGNADVEGLIHLVMDQYKHHSSVTGFGIDVEWYKSTGGPEGEPVDDDLAERWVDAVRSHGDQYRLFLKHWDPLWMPPTVRDGILFVNDSQQFESFEEMLADFSQWGARFAPAPVGFQYGYPADKPWWREFEDPPGDIGRVLLERIPNTTSLFWVDFSIADVFPPQ